MLLRAPLIGGIRSPSVAIIIKNKVIEGGVCTDLERVGTKYGDSSVM